MAVPTTMVAMSNGGQPTSQGHPLHTAWTFWYDGPNTVVDNDWEKSLVPIMTVSTVEDFWKMWHFAKKPSALMVSAQYHFFRRDVKPMWEDEANRSGGKWIMQIRAKEDLARIDTIWQNLLLAVIGEYLDLRPPRKEPVDRSGSANGAGSAETKCSAAGDRADSGVVPKAPTSAGGEDQIMGIALGRRKMFTRISVWTKSKPTIIEGEESLGDAIKRELELSSTTSITFLAHGEGEAK